MAASAVASSTSTTSSKPVNSCSYCGLVLSSANALMEHKRIHTGDRPFSCHICNKRFTQKAHLNIHKRTHTGEKPYACHICHKRFAQSSHLSSHKRIHTGEKPFVCGICHIGFTQKQRLDAHLKKHLERPGQEIVVRQRLLANTNLIEPYKQHSVQSDDISFKKTSQGMTYITSNSDMSSLVKTGASTDELYQHSLVKSEPPGASGESSGDDAQEDSMSDSEGDPKISAPSFSSEGLFLHPSGYVAYSRSGDDLTDESPGSAMTSTANHIHRRKPSVVRKRCSESPSKEPTVKTISSSNAQRLGMVKNELRDEDLSENDVDNFSNTCAGMANKDNTTYVKNKSYISPTSVHKGTARTVNTRSSNRKTMKEDTNFQISTPNGSSNGHHVHATVHAHSDMPSAKVNNRISLVNFTAEELVAHMMKRDDVNKCTFCCLIFQDAAMYHIHRNMHDKSDIRKCNMCGKLLQDKYDFTAHFLSTHQN